MQLKKIASRQIVPTRPFDFDSTFHKPDHFTSGDNFWEPGVRWQTWNRNGKCFGLKIRNKGTVESPKVLVDIYHEDGVNPKIIDSLITELSYRYNLNLDLQDFYQTFAEEKILGPITKRLYGMRPGQPSSLYEYLIIGIVLQNATVRRSMHMFQALLQAYGTLLEYDDKNLWCFWSPGALLSITEEELRTLKVGYRAKSIKKIDDQFASGLMDEMKLRKDNLEVQQRELLKLYGVGPATVWYLLFDVFHHFEFFNHISPWEQKIYSKLFFNQDPANPVPVEKLLQHFEKYSKYKQLAVHYVWEDLWWKRKNEGIPWMEKLIRV